MCRGTWPTVPIAPGSSGITLCSIFTDHAAQATDWPNSPHKGKPQLPQWKARLIACSPGMERTWRAAATGAG